MNGNSFALGATSPTSGALSFSAVTPNISTGVTSSAFGNQTWGSSMTSATGTVQEAAATAGNYVGNTVAPQTFVTGASAINTFGLGLGAKTDWLLPAGIYPSTLTYTFTPGS